MDILDLVTTEHNEYIPRSNLLQAAAESPDIKQSPSTSKTSSKKAQQRQKQQAQENQPPQVKVPRSEFHEYGTTQAILHFLEVIPTNPWSPQFASNTPIHSFPKPSH